MANSVGGENLEHFLALEWSLYRKGVPFFLYLDSRPWMWCRRQEWQLDWCSKHPDDDFVFIDAFDFLFLGEKDELESLVAAQPLIFSCDSGFVRDGKVGPWPSPELGPLFDAKRERESKWCWLNGCGPIGRGSAIAEAVDWGLKNVPYVPVSMPHWPRGGTDQHFWQMVYLNGFGVLDQQCHIIQTLWDGENPGDNNDDYVTPHLGHKDGRIVNLLTGAKPQFIHATGQSWNAIPEELWKARA